MWPAYILGWRSGVGAVVTLPLATPIFRPLAKTAIKGGILAYQGAAELIDGIGDLGRVGCRGREACGARGPLLAA